VFLITKASLLANRDTLLTLRWLDLFGKEYEHILPAEESKRKSRNDPTETGLWRGNNGPCSMFAGIGARSAPHKS
jgi:hypothetical protein